MAENRRDRRGIISIVALGIFTLLTILGMIITVMISHNFSSITNTNNYYQASDIAGSVTGFLEQKLSLHDAGYSTGEIHCEYENGVLVGDTNDPACDEFTSLLVGDHDVQIDLQIKGRAEADEHLASARCESGINLIRDRRTPCFTTPLPGTGDAGERCNLYKPTYNGSPTLPQALANGLQLDQLDYSCNWNRFSSGSSTSDRVSIPLYYSTDNGIINPYQQDEDDAQKFLLRLRTPCLPCVYGDDPALPGQSRSCDLGDDPSVCTNAERYELDETEDEIIVQWQINGLCTATGEECGLIAVGEGEDADVTAVTEGVINQYIREYDEQNYVVLRYNDQSIDVNSGETPNIIDALPLLSEAKLNLFLVNALRSAEGKNVPYLEYQFLSDFPIGSPKTEIKATVRIDDNIFTKTIYKEIDKPLIDFAVQN